MEIISRITKQYNVIFALYCNVLYDFSGDDMGIEKKTYSFRLEDELVEALRQLAEMENRKLSNMVETILKKYVEEHQTEK